MNKILNTKLMHPSEQVSLVMNRIYKRGLTTTSGGNISMIDEMGDIWISPSAVDKGSLKPSDIICVKKDGSANGPHKPSSEFPFHRAIYEMRPDIKAIIHAHPPALVSFSIVRQAPETRILCQAYAVCGKVGYSAYELPGSEALGKKIGEEFSKGYQAIIMENHGTVLGGIDMADVYSRFESLEFCARALLYGRLIGTPQLLTDAQIQESEKLIFLSEMQNPEHPTDERAKRSEICSIVHRACEQGLMISSYGTVSVRWRANDFLITPMDVPRWDLQTSDVVQIKNNEREPGKFPSRAAAIHQEIYRKHPYVNSIISAQPPYLMAFGITQTHFDVRTIPESWIFLQDVPIVPFEKRAAVPSMISEDNPAVIIQNDTVLVTGDKLLQTFDRLEVAEFSAKSIVMSAPLGKMVPINEEQVNDLRRVFLGK